MSEALRETLRAARAASTGLTAPGTTGRRRLLEDLSAALAARDARREIFAANADDMARAEDAEARGQLASALVNRLALDDRKLAGLIDGLRQLAAMDDLVGRVTAHRQLDEGLVLRRVTCPLGVLGVVFEARPDALVQITGLAWKSGNAVVLKGGKEALATNRALTRIVHDVLAARGVDPRAVVLLEDRAEVAELLGERQLVDMMIARGSSAFIAYVRANTRIPVMAHADGVCHVYLHAAADPTKAARIVEDAKCSYPAACNAAETLLWDEGAGRALDASIAALASAGVELRGCSETRRRHPALAAATDTDWDTEYGALVLSIKRVTGIDDALAHIAAHGSRHTDAIVTEDRDAAARFVAGVDGACVFHNASTRFADGYRFGLGAEVGISTDKLHARGPVGVEGLLTYRWLLEGDGHVTADYGEGKRRFLHQDL
jgi:glutamate-5-semialdehyde dehydrogenase